MVNNQQGEKKHYRGSLLAQRILNEELPTKTKMLFTTNSRYQYLENIDSVAVLFGAISFLYLIPIALFTTVSVLMLALSIFSSVNVTPIVRALKFFLMDNWHVNVVAVVIGVCCIHLDRMMTDKMKRLHDEVDINQLIEDYLAWKEKHHEY